MKNMAEVVWRTGGKDGLRQWLKGLTGIDPDENWAGLESTVDLVMELLGVSE